MSAGVYNIKFDKGNYWELNLLVKDSYGNPVDLTGFVGACKIKYRATDTEAVAEPEVTIDTSTGKMKLTLSRTQTLAIPTPGMTYKDKSVFYYDLFIYDEVSGESIRLLNGTVTVSPEVSL